MSVWKDVKHNCRSVCGSYTGNATIDRAIYHGLGKVPSYITIMRDATGFQNTILGADLTRIHYLSAVADVSVAIKPADALYFYVGTAYDYGYTANFATGTYLWTVFA